jgi:uncharacterized protein (DUF305 family)
VSDPYPYRLTPAERDAALASAEDVRERLTALHDTVPAKTASLRDQGPHLKNCEAWTGSGCRCSDLGAAQVAAEQAARDAYRVSPGTRAIIAAIVAVLLIGGGFAAGAALGPADAQAQVDHETAAIAPPGEHSAEAGFARDMQVHHAQAVDMAMTIRDRTTDPAIRLIGYDIALTQQEQIGEMHGWLAQWNLSQTGTDPVMAWMTTPTTTGSTHDMGHMPGMGENADSMLDPTTGLMPGMATQAELDQLAAATGTDAEILFLRLMIRHHQAGVEMAQSMLDRTYRPEVKTLAQTMISGQQSEITQMQDLLTARGAA